MMQTSSYKKAAPASLTMMLKGQLATNGIHDARVVESLLCVDRAHFVPDSLHHAAYVDSDLPLAEGRFLMEPLLFARLLIYMDIDPQHNVLDVGTGLGYSAAVLSHLSQNVVATEESPELVASARKRLAAQHIKTVDVVTAPAEAGCRAHKPYNCIIIEGALREIPQALEAQLCEGGRIVGLRFMGDTFPTNKGLAEIVVGTRHGDAVTYVAKERVSAHPLHYSSVERPFTL
jgi:protein-L-isoaspartate(D-aspartate) O-methyltransferase